MAESFTNAAAPQNGTTSNGYARRDRPCDACRRRKSRCIMLQDATMCIMCQSRLEECTFIENPQRRKRRKLDTDESSPDVSKPRYVQMLYVCQLIRTFHLEANLVSVYSSPGIERGKDLDICVDKNLIVHRCSRKTAPE